MLPALVKERAKPRFHVLESSPVLGLLEAPRTALSANGVGSSVMLTTR